MMKYNKIILSIALLFSFARAVPSFDDLINNVPESSMPQTTEQHQRIVDILVEIIDSPELKETGMESWLPNGRNFKRADKAFCTGIY